MKRKLQAKLEFLFQEEKDNFDQDNFQEVRKLLGVYKNSYKPDHFIRAYEFDYLQMRKNKK